ncbi:CRTAC1 family protein [Devosia sp.]|uniref:CRTAC1 family protein n=1 Tax=Devosia sp. TaxID=1871048 RepID=UPI001AC19A8C|nr:CRTAC1 family protein [Devosia sp.]MBN9310567.1 CRTAC1 family protein [Devosia sp.]
MRTLQSVTIALTLALSGPCFPAMAQVPVVPAYVDETSASGITTSYDGDWLFIVGGGVAAFDCNDDGYPDVVLPGGESKAQLYVNTSKRGGSLSFEPQPSGVELDSVSGAYPADIDSDGITDLVVLRVGENVVMRGLGACRFERANEAWGFDGGDAWSTSLALTFEKGASWPTVAIGNYVDRHEDLSPWGSCTNNWLHRPGDAGRFAAPMPLKPSFCALSMLFTDWDRSGTPSLRVSNDREYYEGGQEQMWRVLPGQPPALLTPADGWKALRIWGMGIASYDLDGDGYPEYFLTSMADNKLQTLAAPGPKADFKDVAYARGVTAHRPYVGDDLRPSTAWHPEFEDVNNDGLVDLFVTKGNVDQMPDFAMRDPDNLLLQGADGKFVETGDQAGIANNGNSRGAALADFNMDGLLDLMVVNRRSGAQVWRNTAAGDAHWISLELRQPAPNEDAIGAWVEVRRGDAVMRRELTVGGGHAGGQLGWLHFGLGDQASASVAVTWPDGSRSEWTDLPADGFYVLERDRPAAPFTPRG